MNPSVESPILACGYRDGVRRESLGFLRRGPDVPIGKWQSRMTKLSKALGRCSGLQSLPLHAGVMAVFLFPSDVIGATTWTVANCSQATNDPSNSTINHTGVLRYVVAHAADGDTIDLSQLACSTITLVDGEVTVPVAHLTLQGPSPDKVTISGSNTSRVIDAPAQSSSLVLQSIALSDGFVDDASAHGARGGCLYVNGDVSLLNASVSQCVVSTNSRGYGGGVFARGSVTLSLASVTDSSVKYAGALGDAAIGGGINAGAVTGKYCTVSNNSADGIGGGISAYDVTLNRCTVDNNQANTAGGGIASKTTISNSTISSNQANHGAGGWFASYTPLFTPSFTLNNSTIAFNSVSQTGAGGIYSAIEQHVINNSIIANNTGQAGIADLHVPASATIDGSSNLILSTDSTVSGLITVAADPRLGPLAYHGGVTRTHFLLPDSPAIDAGNDALGTSKDQRGTGFPRQAGAGVDIGAVESDTIFVSGFEWPSP